MDVLDDLRHVDSAPYLLRRITSDIGIIEQVMARAADEIARLRAEVERLTRELAEAQKLIAEWNQPVPQSEWQQKCAEVEALRQEVSVLRQFGNKDCTAMADEHLAALAAGRAE